MKEDKRFAVLIDADNVSDKYVKLIFNELSNDGIITYKRIYGDWTKPSLNSWKNILLDYSITPIQQYGYTTGKNATDSAMIIDAMDILYTGNVEGFCIVSSDSDFTRLASRLREAGKFVIGMGEKKTPSAFVAACNKFKYLEVLAKSAENPEEGRVDSTTEVIDSLQAVITPLTTVKDTILSIAEEASDESGWSPLSVVGNILQKRFPDFDVRNYGFTKLTPFIRSLKCFEIKSQKEKNISVIYIKPKDPKAKEKKAGK